MIRWRDELSYIFFPDCVRMHRECTPLLPCLFLVESPHLSTTNKTQTRNLQKTSPSKALRFVSFSMHEQTFMKYQWDFGLNPDLRPLQCFPSAIRILEWFKDNYSLEDVSELENQSCSVIVLFLYRN